MPSYKVMTHSLAEQTANLANVFSAVPVLPLAKARIRKQAREGLPVHPGMSAATVASLVDGFILYRYGWWGEDYAHPSEKTLRHAFREAWTRRKLRPRYSDEATRTIKGRSSTIAVLPYAGLTMTAASSSSPLVVSFDIEPVYANGKGPTGYTASLSQSSFQENVLGVTITAPNFVSAYKAADSKVTFELSIAVSDYLPEGGTTQLFFDLTLGGVDRPHDEIGNDLAEVEGSAIKSIHKIQIPVSR